MRYTIPVAFAAATLAVAGFAQTTHTPPLASGASPAPSALQTFTDNCAACHQPDGKGIRGAFPALAGSTLVTGKPAGAILVVLNGRGGMPAFKGDLTNAQIATALTFVRTSWGNAATPVTPAQVAALRTGDAPDPSSKKPIQAN
ncbi:cytochrome c [Sphingomonas sp. PvP056]|jgi:mono/diheme cytochrome c family protein|uniref:c-type cytochrome n=1 Tax=Sphingomonas sp. PvP056 TaxID=3156392 RepID=UPI0033966957